jgi:hypothetical protein
VVTIRSEHLPSTSLEGYYCTTVFDTKVVKRNVTMGTMGYLKPIWVGGTIAGSFRAGKVFVVIKWPLGRREIRG